MPMLLAIKASHHDVSLDELAALTPHDSSVRTRLADVPAVQGVLVLSTCNRFEVYLDTDEFHPAVDATVAAVAELSGSPQLAGNLKILVGEAAIKHALDVTCGLDSMVVGEAEVSGQVRSAVAQCDRTLSPTLRRLFQHALATSKAVATRTSLGAAGRSVASVALDLVETRRGPVAKQRVLVLGTGAFARVVVAELARRQAREVHVYSGSGRAERFAQTHPVLPVGGDDLAGALRDADVVVACSGGADPLLTVEVLTEARSDSRGVLPIVDLSLGRDVEAAAQELSAVEVLTLAAVGEHAPEEAAAAVIEAQDLLERAVEAHLHVEGGRAADPAVTAMRAWVMGVIEEEIKAVEQRQPPEVATVVARSLRRVSGALLHAPSVRAQELARTGGIEDYHRAMHTLLGIELETH